MLTATALAAAAVAAVSSMQSEATGSTAKGADPAMADVQLPAVLEWMFGDAGLHLGLGLGRKAAQMNVLRWKQGSPSEVDQMLSQITGKEATRPIIMRDGQQQHELRFENVAAALTFLRKQKRSQAHKLDSAEAVGVGAEEGVPRAFEPEP